MTITEFQQACSAIEQDYKTKISQAADLAAVEELRVAALGRKGALTELLKGLKDFSIEEKKQAGPLGNALKTALSAALDERTEFFTAKQINDELNKVTLDLTLPGYPVAKGHRHPLSGARRWRDGVDCAAFVAVLHDRPLVFLHRHGRPRGHAAGTGGLAQRRADPAGELRVAVCGNEPLRRQVPPPLIHQIVPLGDEVI
ncbi:MAG: hypothetical protein EGQ14_02415 [Spirochaetia bacterium]|nr:hypothetical protein [Spirochaetia bacterium]